jgi:serine/threonine-protein kinase
MPYVEGESLREKLEREKQLPVGEAVHIAVAVAGALDYAHRHKIIHRDIKPANILIHAGQPVVADFGIALAVGAAGGARLTETGLSVGTPFYMSPEQATGDVIVGPATDIYAIACVLYEMLVGEPPYLGNTAQAVLGKIIAGQAVSATRHRPAIPTNVDAVIRKALEKLPADRFSTAEAFATALTDVGFRHRGGASEDGDAAISRGRRRATVAASVVLEPHCGRRGVGAARPPMAAASRS